MKKQKVVIQRHHIQYADEKGRQDDIVVPLYKGEHMIITRMQWRKKISKGFIKALKHWILVNEDNAVDANAEEEEDKFFPTPVRV